MHPQLEFILDPNVEPQGLASASQFRGRPTVATFFDWGEECEAMPMRDTYGQNVLWCRRNPDLAIAAWARFMLERGWREEES